MYMVLRVIRAVAGLTFVSGILHFVLVSLSSLFDIVRSETLDVFPNLSMLIIGGLLFFAIRRLINYLHRKQFKTDYPKFANEWHL